jgi:hypothetical protein
MVDFDKERRRVVSAGGMAGAGLILAGTTPRILWAAEKHDEDKEKEVGAVEDLMREHGVIRRAILVYRQTAAKLRVKPAGVDPDALRRTAFLFCSFGEDYHEKKLEETHIFPTVKKAGGPAAAYVDILYRSTSTWPRDHRLCARDGCQGRLEPATLNLWRAPWTASS